MRYNKCDFALGLDGSLTSIGSVKIFDMKGWFVDSAKYAIDEEVDLLYDKLC